jgi:hypothetical protein
MPIKAIRPGSQPRKRCQAPTYTQAQVDLIVHQHMESYQVVAHELRQLLIELSKTRQPSRQPDRLEVNKYALLKVLTKSAELADL